jgi:hypothetical protein
MFILLKECWLYTSSLWHGFWLKRHARKYVHHNKILTKMVDEYFVRNTENG